MTDYPLAGLGVRYWTPSFFLNQRFLPIGKGFSNIGNLASEMLVDS
jgi:hypothetical protein